MNNNNQSKFLKQLSKIKPGDHLCLIYETPEEQFAAIIPFIKIGLKRGERCIYIADDNTTESVIKAMKSADQKLFSAALKKGSLLVLTKNETYLKGGYFSPNKMVNFLKKNVDKTLSSGYKGLRGTGEMTWIFGGDPGVERLMEYEEKLNKFLVGRKASLICQYNRRRFSDELLLEVFKTHPFVIYGNKIIENKLYLSKEEPNILKSKVLKIINSH